MRFPSHRVHAGRTTWTQGSYLYQVKVAQNAAFEGPGLMRPALKQSLKPLLKFEFCPKFNIFESLELHLPSL
jgi:hypothetical protein